MVIYNTEVHEIGEEAGDFVSNGMIVLFGSNAPAELRPYCFLIDKSGLQNSIEVGDILVIDDAEYNIAAVGNQVNKNLRDLGHITIDFRGQADTSMSGTLYIKKKSITDIKVGTKILIKRN